MRNTKKCGRVQRGCTSYLGESRRTQAIRGLAKGQFIVAGGFINTFASPGPAQFSDAYSLRFNANRSIDSTYANVGTTQATNDVTATSAIIYPDGSIHFTGSDETAYRVALLSIKAQGSPNNSFDGNSPETIDPNIQQFSAIGLTQQQQIVTLGQNINSYDQPAEAGIVTRFLGEQAPAPVSVLSGGILTISGSGYDELIAGRGNDTLVSGHGGATLIGGSGNDLFESANNKFDTIEGGGGNNTAIADSFDIVTNVRHRAL